MLSLRQEVFKSVWHLPIVEAELSCVLVPNIVKRYTLRGTGGIWQAKYNDYVKSSHHSQREEEPQHIPVKSHRCCNMFPSCVNHISTMFTAITGFHRSFSSQGPSEFAQHQRFLWSLQSLEFTFWQLKGTWVSGTPDFTFTNRWCLVALCVKKIKKNYKELQ